MIQILNELRRALEYEIALGGPFVPMPGRTANLEPDRFGSSVVSATAERVRRTHVSEPADPAEHEPISERGAMVDLFGNKSSETDDPAVSPYERIEALIPEDNPIRGMKTLEELQDYMATHELVPIDKKRINPVFGVGDPQADLMIIGEAPGADEDRMGEPFVGRAGQLLNKILEAVNFKREEVYIANILKSRPPNNRDPLPEEVQAHIPALYKQIVLIKPKIILCVGKTAGNGLLERNSALGTLRNKLHDFHGLPAVVTYHPAALLRNEQWKRPTWEDMKLLRKEYDRLTGKK